MPRCCVLLLLLSALALAAPASAQAPAPVPAKTKITTAADLPVHTYTITSKNRPLAEDPAVVSALAAAVTKDTTGDLAQYAITDRSTLRQMYLTLERTALLQQDYGAVRRYMGIVRSLQDKPADKATSGLLLGPLADALQTPGADFHQTLRVSIEKAFRQISPARARAEAQEQTRGIEIVTRDLLVAVYADKADSVPDTGVIGQPQAGEIISEAFQLRYVVPNKSDYQAALGAVLKSYPAASKPGIWAVRDVALLPSRKLSPVTVAVWDTGVDTQVYRTQLVSGQPGIGYNTELHRTDKLLYPWPGGPAAAASPTRLRDFKGLTDIGTGISSTEAAAFKAKLASLPADQVTELIKEMEAFGGYAHGTHVAGIALRGNPAARLLVCCDLSGTPSSLKEAERQVAAYRQIVRYLKTRRVRVVNISWRIGLANVENSLSEAEVRGTADAQRVLAKKIYSLLSRGFAEAMQGAPGIVFVAAAGNEDQNVLFDSTYPAGLQAPNLLVVGAVDGAGEETSFTSFGNVDVYANGVDVPSFVPGGTTLKLSGTSMAAPQVTNLAAKLLAEHPGLSVAQIKAAILAGADPRTVGGRTIRLLNPKKTLARLNAHR